MSDETPTLRLPKRIVRLQLPSPYDGFWVDAWVNYPPRVWMDYASGDVVRTPSAFEEWVVDHNLVDEEGTPYPKSGNGDLINLFPPDVSVIIVNEVRAAVGKFLPRRT